MEEAHYGQRVRDFAARLIDLASKLENVKEG